MTNFSMDETTEPIIAVVGHPIAGNPTQFALETGLKSAGVDCRVLSFDLNPDRIPDALKGMAAMHFAGAWVTESSRVSVHQWLKTEQGIKDLVDFAIPPSEGTTEAIPAWSTFDLKGNLWPQLVAECLCEQNVTIKKVISIKSSDQQDEEQLLDAKTRLLGQLKEDPKETFQRVGLDDIEQFDRPVSQSKLEAFLNELDEQEGVLVLLEPHAGLPSWNTAFESVSKRVVVVDLSENWEPSEIAHAEHLKATSPACFVRSIDIYSACLAEIVHRLFGCTVTPEIFQDAIDEYLAV